MMVRVRNRTICIFGGRGSRKTKTRALEGTVGDWGGRALIYKAYYFDASGLAKKKQCVSY
jgi:hypothetical protein